MTANEILTLMKIGDKTKQGKIIKYFVTKGEITSFDCFSKFQYTRLSDLIYRMRKAGINVTDDWRYKNEYTKYKVYYLGGKENVK